MRENEQELRLALAMRGGASMAVWIGGAVAEVDRLRRSLTDSSEHPDPWGALARLAGYDSVSVDVLAGTSAGGLNATLLSASIVYGMPFGDMRRMWVQLADLEAMSRSVPKLWQPGPQSLLEGDDYLRAEIARVLTDSVPSRDGALTTENLGDRADLLLTATLLDPIRERHFDARADPITQQRRTAMFRFRHEGRPGQPLSDFGSGKEFEDTALQLAHAARATSSYPFAFERAQVYSSTGKPPSGAPDMFGLFSEVAANPDAPPFRVIDGGVLDNIPVTAAIRSVASASADRPTDRWLLYLNPDPVAGQDEKPSGRLALPVASAALRAKMSQESLLADIRTLDAHNESVDRMALRRKVLFAELRAASPTEWRATLARQSSTVEPNHAVVRAELDAQAVHRLLTEPAGTEDGKLLPPVIGDPLAGWSASARTELADRLSACLGEHAAADPGRVFDDIRGLLSGVQQCLGWAQDIERWAPRAGMSEIGGCKAALYRLQVFGEVLEGHADRYWVHGARLEPIVEIDELDGWIDRVLHRRQRLQHRLPSPVRPLLGAVLESVEGGPRFQRPLAEFAEELLSIVDSSGADAVPVDGGHVDAVADAWAILDRVAGWLAAAAPERTHFAEPEQLGYAVLEQTDQRPVVLRELVVLTAPLDVGRAPGSRINFLRVASDEQTPLPFEALRPPSCDANAALRTEDKIRGSDLGNFGAFLSAKWRANDWMWGRLDAATSLVGLLLDPARLVRQNFELGAQGLLDALQAIVSNAPAGELEGLDEQATEQWQRFLADLWSARAAAVRAELEALFERPDGEHPLAETNRLLTERLHWTIVAGEIPFVATVRRGADPDHRNEPPAAAPERLRDDVKHYSVGRQRLASLGERRTAGMAARFGLLGYRALRPSGGGVLKWLGRWAFTLVKPLLMAVVFALAAPTRAALFAFLAAMAVVLTGAVGVVDQGASPANDAHWLGEPSACPAPGADGGIAGCAVSESTPGTGFSSGFPSTSGSWLGIYDFSGTAFDPGGVLVAVLAVGFAVWLGWQVVGRLSHGHGLARWLPGLAIAVVLVGCGFWLLTTGFRLEPLGLALVAVVLTGLASSAYRPAGVLAAMAVTALAFLLVMWWCAVPFGLYDGSWIAAFLVASAYLHMLLLGVVDVLKPRPRPRR